MEDLSVLLPVEQGPPEHAAAEHGVPELFVEMPVMFAGLEQPWGAAERLLSRIPRGLLEGRVDVDDLAARLGDDHGVGGLLHGVGKTLVELSRPLRVADVAKDEQGPSRYVRLVSPRQSAGLDPAAVRYLLVADEDLGIADLLAPQSPRQR
jgi:hypothetical protein